MPSPISRIQAAGDLDRRVQILGLTYSKIKGEARPTYSELFTLSASKDPQGGTESTKAGAATNLSSVIWRVFYNTQISIEVPNYEALKLAEVVDNSVYLRHRNGEVMYDLFGNPLVSLDDTQTILYDIKDVVEVGRRVAMDLLCERWR